MEDGRESYLPHRWVGEPLLQDSEEEGSENLTLLS